MLSPPHEPRDGGSRASLPGVASGVDVYKRRARIGGIALAVRTGLAQLIILGGTIVLARHVRPAEFGAFAMVQFVLTVLTIFGDVGLGGALVQKKEPPTQIELTSVFYAQLALGGLVVVVASFVAELLPRFWPDLPPGTPWILRALALNFVFLSARTVPTLLMERELLFVRVSILDTVSSVAFYLVAAVLALADFGVWALVLGVLAQGLGGLLTAVVLRPWRPSFAFDASVVRGLLGFGVPYQVRIGLVLLTRSVIPVLGGTMMGSHAVGILNWALETGYFPLTFVEILARVSFPLYSRLQSDPAEFAAEMERSLRVGTAITLFLSGMFLGLAPELTEIIYSEQWLEAVPLLRGYAAAIVVAMLVFLLAPAFDAMGKPRAVMTQMVFVAACVWAFAPLGALWAPSLGTTRIEGFVLGHAASLVLGGVVLVWLVRRELPRVRFLRIYLVPALAGALNAALGHILLGPYIEGPVTLFFAVVAELAVFVALLQLLDPTTFAALRATLPGHKVPKAAALGARETALSSTGQDGPEERR